MNSEADCMLPYVEVLYGSTARGDDDGLSDLDLLIVDDRPDRTPSLPRATLVRYTWNEFGEMSNYGSLFLRHLRKEGQIIHGDDAGRRLYGDLLDRLPHYSRVLRDLKSFELAISDSEGALAQEDTSIEFELASLATVMRHCSILGSYLIGSEQFSRTGAFDLCCDNIGLGAEVKEEFRRLYSYRIAVARGMPFVGSPSKADGLRSVYIARKILDGVREYASCTKVP